LAFAGHDKSLCKNLSFIQTVLAIHRLAFSIIMEKTMRKAIFAFAVLALSAVSATAQTADDIVAKYIKTVGGMEKHKLSSVWKRPGHDYSTDARRVGEKRVSSSPPFKTGRMTA
jgi:hypothetical protein